MKCKYAHIICFLLPLALVFACSGPGRKADGSAAVPCFTNPLRENGSSPCLVSADGRFYYLQSSYVNVSIWSAESVEGLKSAREHVVYELEGKYYISGPRMVRLDGKWYIYFSCEGADMSTRHIHVLENPSEDPLEGKFVHKGVIPTRSKKSVHPFVFSHAGKRWLLWSGFDDVPAPGIVYVNIYMAEMKTPWQLASPGDVILRPKFEWECQWISDNDPFVGHVLYVNEAPYLMLSRDGSKYLLYFAASQTYTPYYCEGMAWADAKSDPMDARNWHKVSEPVFGFDDDVQTYGAGHLSFFRDANDSLYFLYQAYSGRVLNRKEDRSPRMQAAGWGADGIPVLGRPGPVSEPIREPVPVD